MDVAKPTHSKGEGRNTSLHGMYVGSERHSSCTLCSPLQPIQAKEMSVNTKISRPRWGKHGVLGKAPLLLQSWHVIYCTCMGKFVHFAGIVVQEYSQGCWCSNLSVNFVIYKALHITAKGRFLCE